jgi:hypothetical protein
MTGPDDDWLRIPRLRGSGGEQRLGMTGHQAGPPPQPPPGRVPSGPRGTGSSPGRDWLREVLGNSLDSDTQNWPATW